MVHFRVNAFLCGHLLADLWASIGFWLKQVRFSVLEPQKDEHLLRRGVSAKVCEKTKKSHPHSQLIPIHSKLKNTAKGSPATKVMCRNPHGFSDFGAEKGRNVTAHARFSAARNPPPRRRRAARFSKKRRRYRFDFEDGSQVTVVTVPWMNKTEARQGDGDPPGSASCPRAVGWKMLLAWVLLKPMCAR